MENNKVFTIFIGQKYDYINVITFINSIPKYKRRRLEMCIELSSHMTNSTDPIYTIAQKVWFWLIEQKLLSNLKTSLLLDHDDTLEMLNIIGNRMQIQNDFTCVDLSNFGIKFDDLCDQSLSEKILSVSAIVSYLSDKQFITSINLSNNALFDAGIELLFDKSIKNYNGLKVIKISNCCIGDDSMLYFLKKILLFESLEQVNILNNPGSNSDVVGSAILSLRILKPELSDTELDDLENKIIF